MPGFGILAAILGIDPAQTVCFLVLWAMHLYIIRHGTESIRVLEVLAAPFLLAMALALLAWAYVAAGGFGPMLSAPSQFIEGGAKEGQFWGVFFLLSGGSCCFRPSLLLTTTKQIPFLIS